MSEREELQGVARTLSLLADGLVRDGFIDPGTSQSVHEIFQDLQSDLEAAESFSDVVDIKRLPLLLLQVVRLGHRMGVRFTEVEGPDEERVSVSTADVLGGLELMQQAPQQASLELRGVATAISILTDYAFIVAEPLLPNAEGLDVVAITRGALSVAEVSVRAALDDGVRGRIAVDILRRCADMIEAEEPKEVDDAQE